MAAFAKNLLHWTAARFVGTPVAESGIGAPPPLPEAPQPDALGASAAAQRRQRRMGLASTAAPTKGGTLFTGPSGVDAPAATERKTLLGS